jgi:tRNA threonylcarbamoyl adenosine modification protein YeaZ
VQYAGLMLILALDTSLDACSVALFDSEANELRASRSELIGKGHAERLMAMISDVMAEAGVGFAAVDRIGVTIGPGSFTGIRAGLAAARGLGLAAGIPVVGVSTLDAIARQAPGTDTVMVILDARRGEVYTGLYDGNRLPISSPSLLTLESAASAVTAAVAEMFGSGADLVASAQTNEKSEVLGLAATPDILDVARLTAVTAAPLEAPRPLYLRAPDAKPQTRGRVERQVPVGPSGGDIG